MLEGPIGGASFNNEFGRPNLLGYFRTFEQSVAGEQRGYHKPIMIAGGVGSIAHAQIHKERLTAGAALVQLGGPGMLIGLGGGAASSMGTGQNVEDLDFDSVQRGNAEIQRRAQEVIDRCWAMGEDNPILSIHDVGAGGLSNALPELVHGGEVGGRFELRDIPSEEPGMSPMQVWCNEAQERYVLAIRPDRLDAFRALCERERCPFAVVGIATPEQQLVVEDRAVRDRPVDMDLSVLLGKPPKMTRRVQRRQRTLPALDLHGIKLEAAAMRVLRLPAVADKTFLISIGDRTVGGLCSRDQMVGPWQVPVADVAVTLASFDGNRGEAMAMGERTPLALIDAPASGRMAVGEAITNIAAARIGALGDVKLSANWMAAAGSSRRGRGAVRHGRSSGPGAVSRAGHQHSGGQGLDVDEDVLGRGRAAARGRRTAVADRLRLRAVRGCACHAHSATACTGRRYAAAADRPGRGQEPPGRLGARPGVRAARSRSPRPGRPRPAEGILRARCKR